MTLTFQAQADDHEFISTDAGTNTSGVLHIPEQSSTAGTKVQRYNSVGPTHAARELFT